MKMRHLPTLKPSCFSVFTLACKRTFIKTHSIESRCYKTGNYTVCRRVRASLIPDILEAGAVKGLILSMCLRRGTGYGVEGLTILISLCASVLFAHDAIVSVVVFCSLCLFVVVGFVAFVRLFVCLFVALFLFFLFFFLNIY